MSFLVYMNYIQLLFDPALYDEAVDDSLAALELIPRFFNYFFCLLVDHNALKLPFPPSSRPFFRNMGNLEHENILQTIE